jgi:hypothetical protein
MITPASRAEQSPVTIADVIVPQPTNPNFMRWFPLVGVLYQRQAWYSNGTLCGAARFPDRANSPAQCFSGAPAVFPGGGEFELALKKPCHFSNRFT